MHTPSHYPHVPGPLIFTMICMSIIDFIIGRMATATEVPSDEGRKVGFIQERPNVWRVVYVD